ncbi:MAG: hypothetical protein ACLVJH_10125 [Faecalibacterium prausnitzii]
MSTDRLRGCKGQALRPLRRWSHSCARARALRRCRRQNSPQTARKSLPTEDAESGPEPASETPASSVGREYLGVLTIPALGLELPVQTEWSKARPQGLALPSMRQYGGRRPCHRDPQLQVPHFGRLSSLSRAMRCVSLHRTALRQVYCGADCAGLARRTQPCGRGRPVLSCSTPVLPGGKARVVVYCRRENAA